MKMLGKVARRLRILARKGRVEEEMSEEMRFHLEMEVKANLREGMPPEEARRAALLAFGGVERFKERARDARGGRTLDDLALDFRYTLRKLARAPGFTLAVLLTLALGIGANTAVFTLVHDILLEPLPFPAPEELVRVYRTAPERGALEGSHSLLDARDLDLRSTTVQGFAAYSTLPSDLVFTGGEEAREISTAYVSGSFFPVLGVPAQVGRTLLPEEEEGDNRLLVLSHGFWMREFGGDPGVVGRPLDMEGLAFRIVGVMPPGFAFPDPEVEVWTFLTVIPAHSIPLHLRFVRILNAVARLEEDVSLSEAEGELSALAQGIQEETAEGGGEVTGARLVPLQDAVVGEVRLALLVLLGAVGLILILACANVANLLLARGIGRGREMALRAALGAGRRRLVRQLLTESLILGIAGGGLGLILAAVGVEVFVSRSAGLLPRSWEVGVQWQVLLFGLLVSVLTGLLFGLLPALTGADRDPAGSLRDGSARGSTAGGHRRLRQGLVVAQVSVALVLLVGAGLMIRSLTSLSRVDPGFRARGLLSVTISLSDALFQERDTYMAAYHDLLDRFGSLPGVRGAGAIRFLPMRGSGEQFDYTVAGRAPPPEGQEPQAWTLQVSSELFRVMGIPLLAGRSFGPEDIIGAPSVTVINETLAREAFQGEPAVGRTLLLAGDEVEIIGVVGDVHQESLRDPPVPTAYLHQEQVSRSAMAFVLRTDGEPLALAGSLRQAVAGFHPGQPISEILDVTAVVGESTARSRFLTLLLGFFAFLAFVLAGLGIYGVVAYLVARQVREMGIRLALGARPGEAVGLLLRRGLSPVLLGLAVGMALALPLSGFLEGLLFGVGARDPGSFLGGSLLILLVGLLATLIPARRALRVNPVDLLRQE